MIVIHYNTTEKGSLRLEVTGHARSAPKGEDLICAGASILAMTLAQVISFAHADKKLKCSPTLQLEDGNCVIWCLPKDKYLDELRTEFETIVTGYDFLSMNYPEYVKFDVKE